MDLTSGNVHFYLFVLLVKYVKSCSGQAQILDLIPQRKGHLSYRKVICHIERSLVIEKSLVI